MKRIKVTGYYAVDDLAAGDHDPDDPTGLSPDAHERLTGFAAEAPFSLGDLEDLDVELVDE